MEKKFLLNDQEMRKFIVNGYHVVKTSLSLSFHQKVYRQTLDLIQNERPPGNDLLPKIPILADVFTDPVITSVGMPGHLFLANINWCGNIFGNCISDRIMKRKELIL